LAFTFICPGLVIWITPPQLHISVFPAINAGLLAIITLLEPGAHGAVVNGTHGIGVNTPAAAVVADATVGLARDWHMPNGKMLVMGILSMIVAAGMLLIMTLLAGNTIKLEGAKPKLQVIIAPITIIGGIIHLTFKTTLPTEVRSISARMAAGASSKL
jgi:hypothetical protein